MIAVMGASGHGGRLPSCFSSAASPYGFSSSSTLYFIGRAGIRYFLSKLALYADVGAGAATINVGAMFKIN